jgi:nitroreductase
VAFADRAVEPEKLCSLLEAARWAASSFNEQPWYFLVARREQADEFERMLLCLSERNQAWARNAGVLMLTVTRTDFTRTGRPNRCALHDLGQAAASLAVQATALGLRVHQMAGVDLGKARATYGIPPGFEPQTAIAIGYPGPLDALPESFRDAERAPRRRKPQEEFVYAGAWGEAAAW